jgi:hypothetical protein
LNEYHKLKFKEDQAMEELQATIDSFHDDWMGGVCIIATYHMIVCSDHAWSTSEIEKTNYITQIIYMIVCFNKSKKKRKKKVKPFK